MEGSKRTTTRIGNLCFSATAKNKKKKEKKKQNKKTKRRYNPVIKSLLSSNISNRFKFTVTPTRGKNL